MANLPSSRKRVRRNENRRRINHARKSRIRTFIKRVEKAVAAGDKAAAQAAFQQAEAEIKRGVTKGVLHKNAAARSVSRLAKKVKALG